jgi:hypothetical protein
MVGDGDGKQSLGDTSNPPMRNPPMRIAAIKTSGIQYYFTDQRE